VFWQANPFFLARVSFEKVEKRLCLSGLWNWKKQKVKWGMKQRWEIRNMRKRLRLTPGTAPSIFCGKTIKDETKSAECLSIRAGKHSRCVLLEPKWVFQ
jgi:hypothetical protein